MTKAGWILTTLLSGALFGAQANAVPIPVPNFSFENPNVPDAIESPGVPDWTVTNNGVAPSATHS